MSSCPQSSVSNFGKNRWQIWDQIRKIGDRHYFYDGRLSLYREVRKAIGGFNIRGRGTKDYVRLKTIHNEAFNHLSHWATTSQLWHSVCCDSLGCDGLKLKLHVMLQGKMEKLFDSTIKYDAMQWIVISQYITNEGEWNNSQREYMIIACFLEGGCQNCGPYCFVTNF